MLQTLKWTFISFPTVAQLAKYDVNRDGSILSNYELHLVSIL
jgi:hypothetical protein